MTIGVTTNKFHYLYIIILSSTSYRSQLQFLSFSPQAHSLKWRQKMSLLNIKITPNPSSSDGSDILSGTRNYPPYSVTKRFLPHLTAIVSRPPEDHHFRIWIFPVSTLILIPLLSISLEYVKNSGKFTPVP